jgi:hypothetical protein
MAMGIGVAVEAGVGVFAGVAARVGVGVAVGIEAAAGAGVAVVAGVGVPVGVDVGAGVGVGTGVSIGSGKAVAVGATVDVAVSSVGAEAELSEPLGGAVGSSATSQAINSTGIIRAKPKIRTSTLGANPFINPLLHCFAVPSLEEEETTVMQETET